MPVRDTGRSFVRAALRRWLECRQALQGRRSAAPALFLNKNGTRLSSRSVGRLLEKYLKEAGLDLRTSPHTLRHTFARAYLVNGGDAFSLQRILGHATLDMVKRYVALADTDVLQRHRLA